MLVLSPFVLEDEYSLSLGMLMHVKCIHDLCTLPLDITPYLHHILVISMLLMIIGNNSHVPHFYRINLWKPLFQCFLTFRDPNGVQVT
jgi:hypothetical protein